MKPDRNPQKQQDDQNTGKTNKGGRHDGQDDDDVDRELQGGKDRDTTDGEDRGTGRGGNQGRRDTGRTGGGTTGNTGR